MAQPQRRPDDFVGQTQDLRRAVQALESAVFRKSRDIAGANPAEAWHDMSNAGDALRPVPNADWTPVDGTQVSLARTVSGFVYVRGRIGKATPITPGGSGNGTGLVMTIPAEFRPTQAGTFTCLHEQPTFVGAKLGYLLSETNGQVTLIVADVGAAITRAVLDGIVWRSNEPT